MIRLSLAELGLRLQLSGANHSHLIQLTSHYCRDYSGKLFAIYPLCTSRFAQVSGSIFSFAIN